MQGSGHKNWVEISGENLSHNIKSLRSLLNPNVDFCAVVKSNAYGHGLETIVRLSYLDGIRHFAVDSVNEAKKVQKFAPEAEIFILGFTVPEQLEDVVINGFIQNIYSKESLLLLAEIALKLQTPAKINLKVETGTQRQGILGSQLENMLRILKKEHPWIQLLGISSHFANAEQAGDPSFTMKQSEIFDRFVKKIQQSGFEAKYIHQACSAAAILYPETQHNLVRFGISLYGLWSDDSVRLKNRASKHPVDLRPVLRFKTHIAQIKDVGPNIPIGYGCRFIAQNPMRIAILPVGYYDGYSRAFQGKAEVLIRGQKCKVVGAICMNMIMVDVSQLPQVKENDTAILLGQDGMHRVTAEDWAQWGSTINYESVTSIGSHLVKLVV